MQTGGHEGEFYCSNAGPFSEDPTPEDTESIAGDDGDIVEEIPGDESMTEGEFPDAEGIRGVFLGASIVVGMHPDQAAEHIVRFAQGARKPFAVVPCCVYALEFPRRRLEDGSQVKSYEELLEYLVSRDPIHIKMAELPFEGRNKVVYCTSWED